MISSSQNDLPPPSNAAQPTTSTTDRFLTIPNLLCLFRLVGSCGLLGLAVAEQSTAFVGLFLVLAVSDWLDGKLAVWLDQRTVLGAKLDSLADIAIYTALLFGSLWLKGDVLREEWIWIVAALASFTVAYLAALAKFRRLPSYHTRSAKTAWLFMAVAVIALFLEWSVWPLRVAMLVVFLANVESVLITLLLTSYQVDVISVLEARRRRRQSQTIS